MKISIIGSGAMGSLFGGKLSLAGYEVVLYDINRAHVDAVNNSGLIIEELAAGERIIAHPLASSNPDDVRDSDLMIIFVKSTATAAVAKQFSSLASENTIALTLQNGLGNEDIIKSAFGAERTAAGVTSQGATFSGPGHIRHAGNGPTHLCMSGGGNERLTPAAKALREAGFEILIDDDIAGLVWSKLVINAGINALTALTGLKNGELLDYDETRELLAGLVEEAVSAAEAAGITLSYENPVQAVMAVAEKTAANRSSMLQDFDRGSRTEIDFINGAIVREADRHGLDLPLNRTITALVSVIDKRR